MPATGERWRRILGGYAFGCQKRAERQARLRLTGDDQGTRRRGDGVRTLGAAKLYLGSEFVGRRPPRMNQPLQKIIANRYSGRDIPIALVLPDGDRVPLSETPEVDVYARTWQGLKTLASPEMGALARAYVRNDIDFSGGARRVLGIAESLVGSVTYRRDRFAARARTWLSRRRGNRENIQYDYVKAKIAELGLGGRVRVQLLDYLDLPEDRLFDKIASVGMFEHVGVANYPRYFGKIRRILKPGGLVLNHGITHNWPGGDSLGSGIGDFIDEYVFPGGQVAHVLRVIEGLAADGLELLDAEALREHYARTLWNWLDRLEANADAARREVGEEKIRGWRIYLAGSAHAFDRGWLSIFQLLVGKPLPDGRLPHPATREYMYRS